MSAEGAALSSHGREAVVTRRLRNVRPEGPAMKFRSKKMSHLRRSESIFSCRPTALRPRLLNAAPSALCASYHRGIEGSQLC